MLQSFLLGESLFSVGSFRNPSNNCVGQDVRSNIDQPSGPSTRSTIQEKSSGCLQSKDVPKFRWYLQAGKRVPVCVRKQRWSISLWFDVVEEGRLNHFNDKIPPVLKVTFCQWIGWIWAPCSAVFAKQAMRLYAPFHKADILICHRLTVYHQSISHDFRRNLQKFMLRSPTSDVERESINVSKKVLTMK